jgi:heterogeneous nuclear ribonucleoprotein A1/A3
VTFKHVDGALLALKEPSKKIDGRVTVTQLAAAGNQGATAHVSDISMRKIYVANVPFDMPADRLLNQFLAYGDIEEGPLGFDKVTGKSRGFALFVYKTSEGAQAALADPMKVIDGKHLQCKLAIDGKKGKPPGQNGAGPGHGHGDGMGMVPPPGPYNAPGAHGAYSGYSGGPPPHHMNSAPSSMAAAGTGGYGVTGYNGHYSGYGPGSGNYGPGSMGGGYAGPGGGSGPYRMPPSSMSGGGYPESGHYGHSSAASYPGQHQPVGSSPVPRVPLGGMYPNGPPNY